MSSTPETSSNSNSVSMGLYCSVSGSITGRHIVVRELNKLNFRVIDQTNGQAFFEDDERLLLFTSTINRAVEKYDGHVFEIYRMPYPGLGLWFMPEDLELPNVRPNVTIIHQDMNKKIDYEKHKDMAEQYEEERYANIRKLEAEIHALKAQMIDCLN